MEIYPAIEEEGYDNRPSRSNIYRSDAGPPIFIEFVTDSSNEGILTPQDSNSMDGQVRGSLPGAGYTENSEGSLNEYAEVEESLTIGHYWDLNSFNAGFGTQFDTERGNGSQTTGQVDAAVARKSWNDENGG